jgi:hypothetical protein
VILLALRIETGNLVQVKRTKQLHRVEATLPDSGHGSAVVQLDNGALYYLFEVDGPIAEGIVHAYGESV